MMFKQQRGSSWRFTSRLAKPLWEYLDEGSKLNHLRIVAAGQEANMLQSLVSGEKSSFQANFPSQIASFAILIEVAHFAAVEHQR